MSADTPALTDIHLHRRSKILSLTFADGGVFELTCEYLRVHSPSAEVRGHGAGEPILQTGKRNVTISALEPVGNYAVKITFDDGHQTGLYTWDFLHELCVHRDRYWRDYLKRLKQEGGTRDPDVKPMVWQPQ